MYSILIRFCAPRRSRGLADGQRNQLPAIMLCLGILCQATIAHASTVVTFNTNLGSVEVDLFDALAPKTVANFLQYVNANEYSGTVIHRATTVTDTGLAIIQGGGFTYSDATKLFSEIAQNAPVVNEYSHPNTRGTISMARTQDINSATSQWFFNTVDNSTALGPANTTYGPFTVFGQVVGLGMSDVDKIDGLTASRLSKFDFSTATFNYGSATFSASNFASMPVLNTYTQTNYNNGVKPTLEQMVVINSVTATTHPDYQNPFMAVDIDNSGTLTDFDALLVINDLIANGQHQLTGPYAGTDYLDPSGDGQVTVFDALLVVNALIAQDSGQAHAKLAPTSLTGVPEPSSLVLAIAGALALGGFMLRRARRGLVAA